MAEVVECLPTRCKALSSNCRPTEKKRKKKEKKEILSWGAEVRRVEVYGCMEISSESISMYN
jgi:hypothetical protein